jgi:hypothetical protein
MKNPIKTARDRAKRKSAQRSIMGKAGTHRQEREQLAAENMARRDPRARGKAAIKRVGEYKRAKASKFAINRRSQENLK